MEEDQTQRKQCTKAIKTSVGERLGSKTNDKEKDWCAWLRNGLSFYTSENTMSITKKSNDCWGTNVNILTLQWLGRKEEVLKWADADKRNSKANSFQSCAYGDGTGFQFSFRLIRPCPWDESRPMKVTPSESSIMPEKCAMWSSLHPTRFSVLTELPTRNLKLGRHLFQLRSMCLDAWRAVPWHCNQGGAPLPHFWCRTDAHFTNCLAEGTASNKRLTCF